MKTLYVEPWAYEVLLDEVTGEYFIDVLCGTVGMYNVRLKLTDEEVEAFGVDSTALESLADRVRFSPQAFADRSVPS